MSLNFKSKGNCLVSVLACNVMMKAYSDEENWPDDFVKVILCKVKYRQTSISRIPREWRKHFEFSEVRDSKL